MRGDTGSRVTLYIHSSCCVALAFSITVLPLFVSFFLLYPVIFDPCSFTLHLFLLRKDHLSWESACSIPPSGLGSFYVIAVCRLQRPKYADSSIYTLQPSKV